jgi:transcriptional regulator with XRE-family HTH domain
MFFVVCQLCIRQEVDSTVNALYTLDMAEDAAMTKVHARFKESGMTLDELGQKMGYPAETARQSVWQFLKTEDPRISVLRRFARAMGIPITELVTERRKGK